MLVSSGPGLANGSFIAIPENSGSSKDAASAANSPHDTPSVTPTKHIQYKVSFGTWAPLKDIPLDHTAVLTKIDVVNYSVKPDRLQRKADSG